MRVIGLTGGIASGKSSVTHLLGKGLAVPVIDCDEIAREVVKKGRWGYSRIVRSFGTGVLTADGEIDREALGRRVFGNEAERRKLNAATHLPVFLELFRQLLVCWLRFEFLVFVDMPLLFETRSNRLMHKSVVVWCPRADQIKRLRARDGALRSEEEAEARVAAQLPLDRKRALINLVLDNSASKEHLKPQVEAMIRQMKREPGYEVWGWLTSPLAAGCFLLLAAYAFAKAF